MALKSNHKCIQEQHIADIRTLLVGNHEPENGVVYKMLKVTDDVRTIKEDIAEIKGTIKDAIESSMKTAKALEVYRAEIGGVESEKKQTEDKRRLAEDLYLTKRRDRRFMVFQIIALSLTLSGLIWAISKTDVIQKDTTEIKGETTITNDILNPPGGVRGQYYIPPAFRTDTLK